MSVAGLHMGRQAGGRAEGGRAVQKQATDEDRECGSVLG